MPERRFTKADQAHITTYILDTHRTRKSERATWDRVCREIDRQIAMTPDRSHKIDSQGLDVTGRSWLPETELPWQAETLEITTADARRMEFPDSGPWFKAHGNMTDDYLRRVDLAALISGDENEVPSEITQDNVDKMIYGVMEHWHRQTDFYQNMDYINAEACKYGMGVGRGRVAQKSVFMHTSKGLKKQDAKIPVLVPRSIKNTYLDTSKHHLMMEGHIVGPGQIFEKTIKLKDIQLAAAKGGSDGGWLTSNLKGIDGDKHGNVNLLEWEGDMVIPRKTTGSMFLPQGIFTMIEGNGERALIRVQKNTNPWGSYCLFPYHVENIDCPYGTSPCRKGYPLQASAAVAWNYMLAAVALQTLPPVGYDKMDREFTGTGGPAVYPGAQWPTLGEIKVYDFGDPTSALAVVMQTFAQYRDVTGTQQARLGAQTVSHTTAFAKEAELSRGTIRTVDYVRNSLKGPLERWLDMEYRMGRESMGVSDVYIPQYGGWVKLDAKHLPEMCIFEAHGSGGPQEEREKSARKMAAVQQAMQLDVMNFQLSQGQEPRRLNIDALIAETLHEGGWTDIDPFLAKGSESSPAQGPIDTGLASTLAQVGAFGGR